VTPPKAPSLSAVSRPIPSSVSNDSFDNAIDILNAYGKMSRTENKNHPNFNYSSSSPESPKRYRTSPSDGSKAPSSPKPLTSVSEIGPGLTILRKNKPIGQPIRVTPPRLTVLREQKKFIKPSSDASKSASSESNRSSGASTGSLFSMESYDKYGVDPFEYDDYGYGFGNKNTQRKTVFPMGKTITTSLGGTRKKRMKRRS
jgi:hypothetical protein